MFRRVTASDGYDLLFSLLVPQPEKVMVKWDMEQAMQNYVNPFLEVRLYSCYMILFNNIELIFFSPCPIFHQSL